MQQSSGRVFPFHLSYLYTRKDSRHQMQTALTQKSAQHCESAGKTEPGLHVGSLITQSVNATANSDTGAIDRMALNLTQVRGLSVRRDPGYLVGALMGAIEGSWGDHHVYTFLCAWLLSLHVNSSHPVSLPIASASWLILLLPYHLQVPSHLSSHALFPLSNLPAFSPPPAMRWRQGREARMTEHLSPLPPLTSLPFSLLTFPHFFSLFLHLF